MLHQVKAGQLTQRQAAEQLKLSTRWVKKLMKRLRTQGDCGILHGLRGKPSNRKISGKTRKRAIELVGKRYRDYGPTQAAEVLASEHKLQVSRESLRQWMTAAKLWQPKPAKLERAHGWRPRRSCRGELVQWDTSEHLWLEDRGPKLYLIAMIDDATSELTAQFALHDSTAENMKLLWKYVEQHGRPVEFYTDKASLFTINRRLHYNKHLPEPGEEKTQIGRALGELGIGWIGAHSPQAKGRIERCFGTLQDRLLKAMRRAGVSTLEAANRFLEEKYLPEWNERFRWEPECATDAHRPLRKDQKLASILSYMEDRVISNDFTVSWLGAHYQIPLGQAKPRMRKQRIRVEQRLDGSLVGMWQGSEIELRRCQVRAAPEPARTNTPAGRQKVKPNRAWMDHFWHGDPAKRRPRLPVTPVALRAPSVTGNPV
ncbi:MAG TPA: ISNCY family transposase [Bryobacteraceae bacterium]|nr:ISNCY family transposase [Bryobacteraceae bacterium]